MATGASPDGPVLVGKSVTDYTSLAYENAMRLANLSWHLLAVLMVLKPPQDEADHRSSKGHTQQAKPQRTVAPFASIRPTGAAPSKEPH